MRNDSEKQQEPWQHPQLAEDVEDLSDLEKAIAENAGKPLIPWDQTKNELDLN
jgi:hypothetical protein